MKNETDIVYHPHKLNRERGKHVYHGSPATLKVKVDAVELCPSILRAVLVPSEALR